jgi:hypothetical protein
MTDILLGLINSVAVITIGIINILQWFAIRALHERIKLLERGVDQR